MSIAMRIAGYSCTTVTEASGYGPRGRSRWLDVDWREHQRWVRVEDRWANVISYGEGPPVLFVHGLGGSWQKWLGKIPPIPQAGHRAIAVDLPGFGESEMPREKISISGYGRWIESLLEELETGPVALVGNSMGGFIGAETAIKYPAQLERLVLVSAAGITIEHQRNDAAMGFLYRTERVSKFMATWLAGHADGISTRPGLRRSLLRFVMAHPDRLPPAPPPGPRTREQVRGTGKPGFLPALDALTSYPISERLPDIGCPTLI